MIKLKKQEAFTLVELIVAIAILAILWTISFISLQGYSQQARDSTRISDVSTMKSALELFQLDAGKYPTPTNSVAITYSGATVWNQGTFGDTVKVNLSKLDRIPVDPVTNRQYSYSVLATSNQYQLAGALEGSEQAFNAWNQANAAQTTAYAYVSGNYNGQMAKALSWSTCNVLAVPSIISNNTTTSNIDQLVNGWNLVYRGYKNLPATYSGSKFDAAGWFAFTPNNLVAYSDNGSCAALTDSSSYTARVTLLKGLQNAYSWTIVQNQGELKNIMALNINTASPSADVINYAGNFVNNTLWANLSVDLKSSGWRAQDSNCDIDDITIGSQTWAGCNSTLWTGVEWGKKDDGTNGSVWNCYQNYDWTNNTANCVIGSSAMASTSKANTWFTGTNSSWDQEYPAIWWKLYTWANAPSACPTGWHLPSDAEWETLETNLNGSNCRNSTNGWLCTGLGWLSHNTKTASNNIANALKIPLAGTLSTDGSSFYARGNYAELWTSSAFDVTNAYRRHLNYTNASVHRYYVNKAYGFSVRCLKDIPNTYPGCDTPDITVWSYTISACNVWATTAGTGAMSYGNYFQWGNNGWTPSGTLTPSTTLVDASSYGPGNYYNSTAFIGWESLTWTLDWSSVQNDNLWWNTSNTVSARQGPCASGYHVPSQGEWVWLVTAGWWWTNGTNMMNALKLPMAGGRNWYDGTIGSQATIGAYWSSSSTATNAYVLSFQTSNINHSGTNYRAFWRSVRCFKN